MASCTILADSAPYYTVRIEFGEQTFDQTLVSVNTGAELVAQFQAYADQYEIDWNAMQPTPAEPKGEAGEQP
jgi:hypothetical protein